MPTLRALALAVLVSACAPGLSDPERFEDRSCDLDVAQDLLAPRCGRASCHVPFEPSAGLELVTGGMAERLIGRESATCPGHLLIDPDDPSASFLLERLSDEPDCDGVPVDRMPLIGAHFEEAELDCVRQWVEEAAANPPADAGWAFPDGGAPPDGAAPRTPLTLQAESMTLEGYVVDPGNPSVIRLPDGTAMGTATATYDGPAGAYTSARLHVVAENDGQPRIELSIAGATVLMETLPIAGAGMEALPLAPVPITLTGGDAIEIRGFSDASAWARVDRLELLP